MIQYKNRKKISKIRNKKNKLVKKKFFLILNYTQSLQFTLQTKRKSRYIYVLSLFFNSLHMIYSMSIENTAKRKNTAL